MLKNNVVEGIYFGKISYCVTVSFQLNFFLFSDPLDDKVDIEINNIYILKKGNYELFDCMNILLEVHSYLTRHYSCTSSASDSL